MSINQAILLGNVGRAPEIRAIGTTGDKVASFQMATTKHWRDRTSGELRKDTQWHIVVCHNQKLIETIASTVLAGSLVSVVGEIKTRKYEKDGIERRVTEIVIGRFDGTLTVEGSPKGGGAPATMVAEATDNDIPF